jgi:hypothetical protein
MKKYFLLFLIVSFAVSLSAQENTFLLYSIKGNVNVVENKTETKAKIGKLLNNNAVLKVPAGSAVTLICNEAAMFTISKAGSYSLNQFKDSCEISSSSVSANYVKYVWNQMTKSQGSPGSNRKAFMNTVGAVSRSVNNIWIDPRLDSVNYAGGDFPLSWKSYADAKEFEFSLFTAPENGQPLFKTTITKLKIPITKFATQLKTGNTYYWTAAVKGEENPERKVLTLVNKSDLDQLVENLKATGPSAENEAEQAYRLAFSLEDLHYLADAYKYYMKAATLKPDMPLYRSTLMSFKKDYEIK